MFIYCCGCLRLLMFSTSYHMQTAAAEGSRLTLAQTGNTDKCNKRNILTRMLKLWRLSLRAKECVSENQVGGGNRQRSWGKKEDQDHSYCVPMRGGTTVGTCSISEKLKSRQLLEADVPKDQPGRSKTYRQVPNILEVETIWLDRDDVLNQKDVLDL